MDIIDRAHFGGPVGGGSVSSIGSTVSSKSAPLWTLCVSGRVMHSEENQSVVDGEVDEDCADISEEFWDLFEDVSFELPADLYPRDCLVRWTHDSAKNPSTGLRLRREGSRECDVRLRLRARRREGEELRYTLSSPALSALLGFETGTVPALLRAFWAYVEGAGLVEDRESLLVRLDEPLQRALHTDGGAVGEGTLSLTKVLDQLRSFLVEADPTVDMEYRLNLGGGRGGSGRSEPMVVEFEVPTLAHSARRLRRFLNSNASSAINGLAAQCGELDSEIEACIDEIEERRRKRAFLCGLAERPAESLQRATDALALDLETLRSDGSGPHCALSAEKVRRAHIWQEPWVQEAALHYLWSQVCRAVCLSNVV